MTTKSTDAREGGIFAIGNEELFENPVVEAGDRIVCPHCSRSHRLHNSEPPLLLYYKCRSRTYLAAVDGHLINGLDLRVK